MGAGEMFNATLSTAPSPDTYLLGLVLVPEENLLLFGDGGRPVEIHQLIQGVELFLPEEIFAIPLPEHLEVLDILPVAAGGEWMLPRLQDGGSNQPSSSITSKAQGPLTDLGIWRGCGGYSCAHRSPCSCNAMDRGDGGTGVTPGPASEVVGDCPQHASS